jgi:hypothetical protein
MIAGDDLETHARQSREYSHGGRIKDDAFPSCLAIRQKQEISLQVNPLPPKIENFSKPRTCQNQKPQRCRCVRSDQRALILLFGNMLCGSLAFANDPWKANCFSLADCLTTPGQFLIG